MSQGTEAEIEAVTNPAAVAGRFDAAYRDVRADDALQFDLPDPVVQQTPGWLIDLLRFLAKLNPAMQWLFWGGVAVVAALILWMLYQRLRGRGFDNPAADAQPPVWRPSEAPVRALLGEADALAAEGRFAEAVHLLLCRSLEDIGGRLPDFLQPALTSRDIAAASELPRQARAAFAEIAAAVERSLFGGQAVEARQWVDCRAAYERFAFSDEWARP